MNSLLSLLQTTLSGAIYLPFILLATTFCSVCCTVGDDSDDRRAKYIEFSEGDRWSLQTQGDYHCRYDRRNLYCMYHLTSTAATGDHATLTTTVTIPANWQPPYGIEFYCSDDYIVRPSDFKNTGWMAVHAYPGHRFKQVLIDGKVVWDVDVGDVGREAYYGINITDLVEPGKPFELTLRMLDKVGTEAELEGEFVEHGAFRPNENPRAFMTHLYWGDLLVSERFNPTKLRPFRESPDITALRERIAEGLVPRGPAVTATAPATLTVEAPRGLAGGYPLSCGVPLPEGAVQNGYQLRLHDAYGTDLAPQVDELSHWQDGSVRWALVSLPLPDDVQPGDEWTLTWEADRKKPRTAVHIEHDGDDLTIDNGIISVRVPASGPSAIAEVVSDGGQLLAGPMAAYSIVDRDEETVRYQAQWEGRRIINKGPRQVTVELRGKLVGPGDALGRCVFRFTLTDGSPLLRVWYRIFNDTEEHLKIAELTITQGIEPGATRGHVATIEKPDGWFAVDSEDATVFAAVRWAAEMPTKVLELDGNVLAIRLFAGTEEIPHFRPRSGEARRHELLLGYGPWAPANEELAAFAACCQRPPRLWNSRYACETGALGYGYVHSDEEFAPLTENRTKHYGDLSRDRVGQNLYDMRNFGDRRYHTNQWCNNYYDASRGFIAEYVMTGNPNAFDRAAEEVIHQIDVDTCHWATNPTFVGGLWSYSGDDHSNAGYVWAALLRCGAGWDYYYRMTGDPDAREAVRDLAEYVLRDNHNVGFGSVRDHGGTLTALVWAYDEFGDERYLQGALETMADIHTRMVRRRGPYVEPNGDYSWWVSIPWMASEMADAHYRLWQLSGNEEAAATALGLIVSMMMENGTWGVPGEMGGYSGSPWVGSVPSNYNIIIAPVMGYGYEMTGDPEFLLWARACFERSLDEDRVDAITNNYWLTPNLLYILSRYQDIEATMPESPAVHVPPNVPR